MLVSVSVNERGGPPPHTHIYIPHYAHPQRYQILGRLASQIAYALEGKYRVDYTPHRDEGDNVVVLNVDRILLSGSKWKTKLYRWHTGYPGGLKEFTARQLFEVDPTALLRIAVSGMLPKNRLRRFRLERLKMYPGTSHPHTAQFPGVTQFRKFINPWQFLRPRLSGLPVVTNVLTPAPEPHTKLRITKIPVDRRKKK